MGTGGDSIGHYNTKNEKEFFMWPWGPYGNYSGGLWYRLFPCILQEVKLTIGIFFLNRDHRHVLNILFHLL